MIFSSLYARQPGSPLSRILWWYGLHHFCYWWVGSCYRYRAWGTHHIPRTGPVLFLSNHQSFLDPILVGLGAHRRQFYALARSTLLRPKIFGWLIRSLNAIPVERGASDVGALRQCIDVLQRGHALLLFPEGRRTEDGSVGAFQNGTLLIIKRAMPQVVPVAIEGAFQAWPRTRALPKATGRVGAMFGQPIAPQDLLEMGATNATRFLQTTIDAMRRQIQSEQLSSDPRMMKRLGSI